MGKKKIKNVLVLLGDASYPDPVKKGNKFNPEDFEVIWQLKQALSLLQGYNFEYFPDYIKEGNGFYQKGRHDELEKKLDEAKTNCDFVLNFCDEGLKNDPEKEAFIPELLESYGLRYSGAGPRCLLLCYNKWAVKAIARYANIPVTKHLLLTPGQEIKALPFDFPAFVKPNYGDGSFCIDEKSLVKNFDELVKQVENIRQKCRALGRDETLLIEEYLPGKEISAAIIGNGDNLEIKLIEEVFGATSFNTASAKWDPESEDWKKTSSRKAQISKKLRKELEDYSAYLFNKLGCRDYARFDFRFKDDRPYFMEANPNCGWCIDGHLVKAFSNYKIPDIKGYSRVLKKILDAVESRLNLK